jgi:DNA polymerase III delta prime subunit
METAINNSLWVEKYRPDTLENYIGNDHLKGIITKYLDGNDIQNLIFYGPAGTGKTTLAKLLTKNLNCEYLYINASDERGIETIRDKVSGFASTMSFKPLKVVILDEADFLTIQAQASLRNVIETFSKSTRFILTCNYVERIIDPLQSRCQVLKIVPPSKGEVAKHLFKVLSKEVIQHSNDDLKNIVNQYYPDVRKMLNVCQMNIKITDNQGIPSFDLVLDKQTLVSSNYIDKVIELLPNKKSFRNIRQVIADSNVQDFEALYKALYERIDEYTSRPAEAIIIIEEYMYHSNFRIDKEINIMACISKLLEISGKVVL